MSLHAAVRQVTVFVLITKGGHRRNTYSCNQGQFMTAKWPYLFYNARKELCLVLLGVREMPMENQAIEDFECPSGP